MDTEALKALQTIAESMRRIANHLDTLEEQQIKSRQALQMIADKTSRRH